MRVRVAAIVIQEGQVLLVATKRGRPGYLVPPGGGVEAGETVREAVEREVAEEAGMAVRAGDLLAYRELRLGAQVTLELYLGATLVDAGEAISPEGRGVHWVPCDALASHRFFPAGLPDLCVRAQAGAPGALYLGVAQL